MTFQLDPPRLHGWLAGFGFVVCTAAGSAYAQSLAESPSGFAVSKPDTVLVSPSSAPTLLPPTAAAKNADAPDAALTKICPVQPVYPLPSATAELEALLARLDANAPFCLNSAPFHAWRGATLLSQGRPAPAIESLERALLINPDLPGAQFDYASALIGVGDTRSARELLLQLSNRQDLTPGLRQLLDKELAASNPDILRSRWLLTTAAGVDSNLNNAPSASELTLTFPQGSLTLPLLESSRPRRGLAALGIAQWQGLKPQGSQLWLFQADLRARHTGDAETRYQQADVAATWLQAQDAPRQWIARVGGTQVVFGGQQLLRTFRASLQHQWQASGNAAFGRDVWAGQCRPSAGLEFENRLYPSSRTLDGRYVGALAAVVCTMDATETPGGLASQLVNLQARTGTDRASAADRPGANFTRSEVRAGWEGRYASYKLSSDYGFSRQTDAAGYSPLLADNLKRNIKRHTLRAELSRPFSAWPNADWFLSAEINVQHSNLEAFRSRQTGFYSGIRWSLQ
ncbi:MAG: Tetratricopeptide repeat-containing protein [Polaromonas sp.]|nr:Tetratricopeptide repeat-containing protein [Polaromonas sp.]